MVCQFDAYQAVVHENRQTDGAADRPPACWAWLAVQPVCSTVSSLLLMTAPAAWPPAAKQPTANV